MNRTAAEPRTIRQYLRLPEVSKRTGLARSTLYVMMERGDFPRPRRISRQLVAWPEHEVVAWMGSRPLAGPEPDEATP